MSLSATSTSLLNTSGDGDVPVQQVLLLARAPGYRGETEAGSGATWLGRGWSRSQDKLVSSTMGGIRVMHSVCMDARVYDKQQICEKCGFKRTQAVDAAHITQAVSGEEGAGGMILQMPKHFTFSFL